MSQARPNRGITNVRRNNPVKLLVVHVPSDALTCPVARRPIPNDAPALPLLVGDLHRRAAASRLVAHSTRVLIAVHSSVSRQLAVDGLKNIELTTPRPSGPVSNGVAQ